MNDFDSEDVFDWAMLLLTTIMCVALVFVTLFLS